MLTTCNSMIDSRNCEKTPQEESKEILRHKLRRSAFALSKFIPNFVTIVQGVLPVLRKRLTKRPSFLTVREIKKSLIVRHSTLLPSRAYVDSEFHNDRSTVQPWS